MDKSKYSDISPYFGEDVIKAVKRLEDKRQYFGVLASILTSGDLIKTPEIVQRILSVLPGIKSYDDFQRQITAGILIPEVIDRTISSFTFSGGEELDDNKGYLFVSNHRDIILDCMLLDYALLQQNKPLCEMAVGDNLMASGFVEDLFRINGGIIVKRNLPMREKYMESIRLSEYFIETVSEEHKSIWVAQKSGRSKDGLDNTQSAIIKMLYLSKRKSGISFSSLISSCNIVPVAISYEYDPNDINKGREEISKENNEGKYEKKKYEDVISMVKGLRCKKGQVHVAVGKPLEGEYNTPEEVANAIDQEIHSIYRLYDTNYLSYDTIYGGDRFKEYYKDFDKEAFLSRYSHLSPEVRSFVLNTYANPVVSAIKAKESEK